MAEAAAPEVDGLHAVAGAAPRDRLTRRAQNGGLPRYGINDHFSHTIIITYVSSELSREPVIGVVQVPGSQPSKEHSAAMAGRQAGWQPSPDPPQQSRNAARAATTKGA